MAGIDGVPDVLWTLLDAKLCLLLFKMTEFGREPTNIGREICRLYGEKRPCQGMIGLLHEVDTLLQGLGFGSLHCRFFNINWAQIDDWKRNLLMSCHRDASYRLGRVPCISVWHWTVKRLSAHGIRRDGNCNWLLVAERCRAWLRACDIGSNVWTNSWALESEKVIIYIYIYIL